MIAVSMATSERVRLMKSMDDLPPIPPENRAEFQLALDNYLGILRGDKIIYSERMASRIAKTISGSIKKDPRKAQYLARVLRGVPELDALVAKALQAYKQRGVIR